MDIRIWAWLSLAVIHPNIIGRSDAIQCYSCSGAGPNEIEANIRCLETAYLENCDDFYEYYSEVEDADDEDDEYYDEEYYYDDEEEEEYEADEEEEEPMRKPPQRERPAPAPPKSRETPPARGDSRGRARAPERGRRFRRASAGRGRAAKDEYEYGEDDERAEPNGTEYDNEFDYTAFEDEEYDYGEDFRYSPPPGKSKSVKDVKKARKPPKKGRVAKDEGHDEDEDEDDGGDDEEEEEARSKEGKKDVSGKSKMSLPKDPEHWCYSQTSKNAWESYKVEKGCKKIKYCHEHMENFPEWGLPWNFCCDRPRCNVKLVKDKPQRIHGMGCRRTDDCIQGHTNRQVCPGMFKSCPRISSSVIKMECLIKSQRAVGPKNTATFFDKFREKKCYCAKGYFPRGPICTSDASRTSGVHLLAVGWLLGLYFLLP